MNRTEAINFTLNNATDIETTIETAATSEIQIIPVVPIVLAIIGILIAFYLAGKK